MSLSVSRGPKYNYSHNYTPSRYIYRYVKQYSRAVRTSALRTRFDIYEVGPGAKNAVRDHRPCVPCVGQVRTHDKVGETSTLVCTYLVVNLIRVRCVSAYVRGTRHTMFFRRRLTNTTYVLVAASSHFYKDRSTYYMYDIIHRRKQRQISNATIPTISDHVRSAAAPWTNHSHLKK